MKKSVLTEESLTDQISYGLLLLLFICLPLDRFFCEVLFIGLTVHTCIQFNKTAAKRIFSRTVVSLQAVYWITIISTSGAIYPARAFEKWAIQLPLLLIPMLFAFHQPILRKHKTQLLSAFAWSCVAVVCYLYFIVAKTLVYFNRPWRDILSASFVNHNFSAPVNIHATFFSLLLVMAFIFFVQNLLEQGIQQQIGSRLMQVTGTILLLAAIIQLCSKTAIISLIILAGIFIPVYYFKGKRRLRVISFVMMAAVIMVGFAYTSSVLKQRLFADLESDVDLSNTTTVTDSRLDRWSVCWDVASKKLWFGYGTGAEYPLIHQALYDHKLYHSYLLQLNAHNEYLSLLIASGVLGLGVYLTVLFYNLMRACKQKDILLTGFVILFLAASFSENTLDANKGVFFYSMFMSLTLLTYKPVPVQKSAEINIIPQATLTSA